MKGDWGKVNQKTVWKYTCMHKNTYLEFIQCIHCIMAQVNEHDWRYNNTVQCQKTDRWEYHTAILKPLELKSSLHQEQIKQGE